MPSQSKGKAASGSGDKQLGSPRASPAANNNKKKTPTQGKQPQSPTLPKQPQSPTRSSVSYPHLPVILLGGSAAAALLVYRFVLPQPIGRTPEQEADQNLRMGLLGSLVVLVTLSAVYFPNTMLTRPHPAVWRVFLSLGLVYMLLLVFLLFQDVQAPYRLVRWYDPSLSPRIRERGYAEDCRVFTENNWFHFVDSMDEFVAAHFFGYVVKTIVLRDWRLVTGVSLGFELVEVSFQHILPNFLECWWDHLILDVLLCNGGGTLVGMLLLKWLRAKQYHFVTRAPKGVHRKLLKQLVPEKLEQYRWQVFESPKRLFAAALMLGLVLLQDMNTFTSKAMLQVEHEHHLVCIRMALWALLAIPTTREFYDFIQRPSSTLGTTACVTMTGMLLETVVLTRMIYVGGHFSKPLMPLYIAIPWVFIIICFSLWVLLYFTLVTPFRSREPSWTHRIVRFAVNLLFYATIVMLLALFLMGLPDLQVGREAFVKFVQPYEYDILFWRRM